MATTRLSGLRAPELALFAIANLAPLVDAINRSDIIKNNNWNMD